MVDENNAGANNNAAGGDTVTPKPNAGAGDTADNNGKGDEGKTIPVESYHVIRDKYTKAKEQLEKIEADKAKAEQDRLVEQGKFKELADKEKTRADALQQNYESTTKVNALKLAAIQAGTVDADAVEHLAGLAAIKLAEDGSIDGDSVNKVVESLKTSKPYLFGETQKPKPNVGANGGSPSGDAGDAIPTFSRSQLRDSSFYKANEKDILRAAAAGKIIDDITPQQGR